jgi:hypothetical protein
VRLPLSLALLPPANSALSSVVTPAALTVYVVSLDRQRAADVVVKVVKATAGWHMRDSAKSTSVLLSAVVDRLWPAAGVRATIPESRLTDCKPSSPLGRRPTVG